MTRFFLPECGETIKGQVHVALCGLALLCTAYNAIAFTLRRQPHLALNTIVYGSLALYEVQQIARHAGDPS